MVSDSCDDLWDYSSNEGGEILSDSDTSDDITSEVTKRDAQKKYELVSKAEKAFAEMLSRLNKKIPPKTLTPPIVCSKNTKKKVRVLYYLTSSPLQSKQCTICLSHYLFESNYVY